MGAPVTIEVVPRGILWTQQAWIEQGGMGGYTPTPERQGFFAWETVNLASHMHGRGPAITVFEAHERSGKNGLSLEGQAALDAWEAWKAWIRTQAESRP